MPSNGSAELIQEFLGSAQVFYFRDRCLVRQLVKRNCLYVRHRNGIPPAQGPERAGRQAGR